MDLRPIGVFDSGLGGLTTVSELRRRLPAEHIVYFGDTGRVPYGTRSVDTLRRYVAQDIGFLLSQDVKLLVVACNTASTIITPQMRAALHVPLCEVVTPAVSAALAVTKNKKVGVIGTAATVRSGAYRDALQKGGVEVTQVACPLFVPLVENGFTDRDNPVTRLVTEGYLAPLREAGVDTLILGCTHYPLLQEQIADYMGSHVTLIDSGRSVAEVVAAVLEERDALNLTRMQGRCHYYVSDDPTEFQEHAARMVPTIGPCEATRIDLDRVVCPRLFD